MVGVGMNKKVRDALAGVKIYFQEIIRTLVRVRTR
jgi:hypothetical protein